MSGIANWQAQIRIDIEDLKKRIKVAEGGINICLEWQIGKPKLN